MKRSLRSALPRSWPRRLLLALCVLLAAGGVDLISPDSRLLTICGVGAFLLGVSGSLLVLFPGFGQGLNAARAKRGEITIAIVATGVSIAILVIGSAVLRIAPRKFALDHQKYDADLGWAADDQDGTVGQRAQKIDPKREHIVIVGDSILYGHGLAVEQTAAYLVDDRFKSSRYQVLNLSVSGWSIDQYWLTLEHELPRLNPKVIIVGVYSGNDFQVTNRNYSWGHTKPYYVMNGNTLVRTNPDLLADNCIDHLAQSLLFRLLWMRKDFAQDLIDLFCGAQEQPLWQGERAIAKMFDRIEALGRERGVPVLFLLLSERMDIPGDTFEENYVSLVSKYGVLRQLLIDGGHELQEFPADLVAQNDHLAELFLDAGHYNAVGQRQLATVMERELANRYGIRPGSEAQHHASE